MLSKLNTLSDKRKKPAANHQLESPEDLCAIEGKCMLIQNLNGLFSSKGYNGQKKMVLPPHEAASGLALELLS